MGRRGRCCRKRWAVSAGGRSLYEIDRDSGSRLVFWDSPPVPLFTDQREADPA